MKVLPPELAYDAAIRMRFKREAQTSAQLSHSHIVPIYDVGERDGELYLTASRIGGGGRSLPRAKRHGCTGRVRDGVQRRSTLARQLDSAGLALGNLRLDLVKLQSSGLSALSDVTSATQQARALSREIGVQLEAAAEVRAL